MTQYDGLYVYTRYEYMCYAVVDISYGHVSFQKFGTRIQYIEYAYVVMYCVM